jgi:hypothetical protein
VNDFGKMEIRVDAFGSLAQNCIGNILGLKSENSWKVWPRYKFSFHISE